MGFKKQSSEDEGSVRKLHTGMEKFKITGVNPTKDELSVIGINVDSEPVYTGMNDQSVRYARITFFVDNYADERGEGHPVIKTNHSFYIYDRVKVSSNGKVQVINDYGQSSWLTKEELASGSIPENMRWLNTKGIRESYEGEGMLVDFLRAFFNVSSIDTARKNGDVSGAEAFIENPQALFAGDFSEMKNGVMGVDNKVKILLGVKDAGEGKFYQTTYNRNSVRVFMEDYTNLGKKLKDYKLNGGASNIDFGNYDFVLREYDPNAIPVEAGAEADDGLVF